MTTRNITALEFQAAINELENVDLSYNTVCVALRHGDTWRLITAPASSLMTAAPKRHKIIFD